MLRKAKENKIQYRQSESLNALKSIKTTWDLKGLYYKSANDPRIEADIKKAEKMYTAFAKKWLKADFETNKKLLREALAEYEEMAGEASITRPGRYFGFRKCLNVNDVEADRHLALISERLRKASDQILFFSLRLGKIPEATQKSFLKDPEFKHFRYYLDRLFKGAKYDLSEPEEKIVRLKTRPASSMWHDAVEKIISNRQVRWKGKSVSVPEALEKIDLLKTKDKIKLWDLLMTEMQSISEVAEHEMNALISDARNEDELRGYKKPYSATAFSYEDDEKNIENLVAAVSGRGFKLSQEFYKLKAKYHKVKTLHYTQKYESIGPDINIPFEQAVGICRDVFYGLKNEYGQIFDAMLAKGQIDVFPKPGKRGGAFMSNETGHPTHVFLNHVANFKSLETLAHEMGHAIHAERSATQTPFYDGHSIATAETASTLFENLVFDAVMKEADEKTKTILLHDRITRDIATIERQVAFFNAELEMHNTIKQRGFMSGPELADAMYRHLKSYLGPAIDLDKKAGYSYVYIPHLRYGFYVYTYAFGILMSTLMANRYREDKSYINEIDKFLSAGSSDTVSNIFKSIGIDTSNPDTFKKALDNHARDIAEFKKLVR